MPIAHPGPPKYQPPRLNGSELHVHPHRKRRGMKPGELALVCLFLRRYVVWCAKAQRIERARNAIDLLLEVARVG